MKQIGVTLFCISLAILSVSCGSSPTQPDTQPPPFAAGDTLVGYVQDSEIRWELADGTYRFSQIHETVGLVSWERGRWWFGSGWNGESAVWFARDEGAILTHVLREEWQELHPAERPYDVVRGDRFVGLAPHDGTPIYYEVR